MRRLKVKELVAEAHASVAGLPPAQGQVMREVASRLDTTFVALTEAMDQLVTARAEIEQLRHGAAE
ncbi:hypothetical protein U0026_09150 [Kluyvera intermedia]|uniref:hypothetical protein n=1 Tax=Kluyvera intermedia TaxID=61648 RepID=UPI0007872E08|nr:hypothetical protein [Kluyvera intermedia]WQD31378.1 hypothetical protein U0026_09150 [Kluyvera intermedia]VDZ82692.1 Uncharacterised protein [Kluyvera intermedia]